jgi:hypothetical protein
MTEKTKGDQDKSYFEHILDKMDMWFQHLFTSDRRRPSIQVPKFNTMSREIHLQ